MPTNKQRRQAAQRRLQRQIERRAELARKRRRNLLIVVWLGDNKFEHSWPSRSTEEGGKEYDEKDQGSQSHDGATNAAEMFRS